jgi:hypothetical protein
MARALFASDGFCDNTARACLRRAAKRSAGGSQDTSGKHNWIMQSQTADIDGKGWHEMRSTVEDKSLVELFKLGHNFPTVLQCMP